jgi:hypothetical protein
LCLSAPVDFRKSINGLALIVEQQLSRTGQVNCRLIAVKPFVIGRKNWLFNHNHRGAEASAMLYSIIEMAKANGLTPFNYIKHCLEQLSHHHCDLNSLLPWLVNLGKA